MLAATKSDLPAAARPAPAICLSCGGEGRDSDGTCSTCLGDGVDACPKCGSTREDACGALEIEDGECSACRGEALRAQYGFLPCSSCRLPAHKSESDDLGRCRVCVAIEEAA